jgi:hypothetical protein
MKKISTFLPAAMLLVASSLAFNLNAADQKITDKHAGMHKQLNIMNNIMVTSFSPDNSRGRGHNIQVDSTYLTGQGIIFTINSSSYRESGQQGLNFVMPPMPVMPMGATRHFNEREYSEREILVSDALQLAETQFEQAVSSLSQDREHQQELREEQRDLAHELRDLEREMKDLAYQEKRADKQAKKELKQVQVKLKQQKHVLQANADKLVKRSVEYSKKQKQQQLENEQARKSHYLSLAKSIAESLCWYGNGLKALAKNERVSIILKSAGDRLDRRYQDKIFIYDKQDISACSSDKIDIAKLLQKGNEYQF